MQRKPLSHSDPAGAGFAESVRMPNDPSHRQRSGPAPVPRSLASDPPEQTGSRPREPLLVVGRYEVHQRIAAGGMATVHLGRLQGAAGFSRTVAIKRLLPQFALDPDFTAMFVDEARVAARIQHPNVCATIDVVASADEVLLVLEYVHGESLARLMTKAVRTGAMVPMDVAVGVMCDALYGLHAAHEAKGRSSELLGIVHRDVSPQNVIVGVDGVSRVLDFGIAKAQGSFHATREGLIRGKASYMAPEQFLGGTVSRGTDLYAVGVLLWELLVSDRLFPNGTRPELANAPPVNPIDPRARVPSIPTALAEIVVKALQHDPAARFPDARSMALALEQCLPPASRDRIGAWVQEHAAESLCQRQELVDILEASEIVERSSSAFPAATEAAAEQPRRKQSHIWIPAIGALLLAIATAGVLIARDAANDVTPDPPAVEPKAATASNKKAPETPTAAEHKSVPVIDIDELAAVAASSAPKADEKKLKEDTEAKKAATPPPRAVHRPPPRKKPNCTPPFTTDAAGRRHYKPECF